MKHIKKFLSIFFFSLSSLAFANTLIKTLYKDKNGFAINNDETSLIERGGGNATYGEITDEAVQKIIEEIKPSSKDVFYDLGSGIGRMTIKMYLDSPVGKSTGIELSPTRYNHAVSVKKELEKQGKTNKNRLLNFRQEDILKATIDDATIVYLASTCFSDDFMKKITDKLAGLKKGLKVFTLRQLAKNDAFKLVKDLSLPMTWSNNVSVHWYELQ